MRVVRILLIVLVVLGALAAGAAWYLLGRQAVPETSDYALDLAELRRLASALPGEAPVRVNHAQVAEGSLPKGAVFAGESISTPQPMSHGAYQLVYADGTYAMIDSAFDAEMLAAMNPDATLDPNAWAAIQRGLAGASFIAITHEHADHIGGVAKFAEPEKLGGRLYLTAEQHGNKALMEMAKVPESLLRVVTPLVYDRYHPLGPGVVLVKAAGHTVGSQMVFVRLASGKELLFVGDVAWNMRQITELWYRPRLVTDYFIGENRAQVMAQFRTLHDLAAREPAVQIVVPHDVDQRKELIAAGLLNDGFAF